MKINIDDQLTEDNDNIKINIEDKEVNRQQIQGENFPQEDYLLVEKKLDSESRDILKEEKVEDIYEIKETYKKDLGKITVYEKLDHINGVQIEDAQVNLYKLSSINPELVATKKTDKKGRVEFDNLEYGNYRVIAILDKRFFIKPQYYRWNEININATNKEDTVIIVNKIKPEYKANTMM